MSKRRLSRSTRLTCRVGEDTNTSQSGRPVSIRIGVTMLGLPIVGPLLFGGVMDVIASPMSSQPLLRAQTDDLSNRSTPEFGNVSSSENTFSGENTFSSENTYSSDIDDRDVSNNATPEIPERQQQPAPRQSSLGAALRTLREQLERRERPLGSRGAQCPYSPGLVGANDTIWSDRPVFLWRSTGQTLSLYDYDTDELLWQQQVEAGTEAVVYDGTPLQAGGLYRWVLMHPETSDFNATFVVMEEQERDMLAAELRQEEAQWAAAGLTVQQQAVERAMFFGDRRLWSDALQEIHTIRGSAEVDDMIREMSIYLCGTLESDIQAQEQRPS